MEEVGSLLEGDCIVMTASRAVEVMVVAGDMVEVIMETGVTSLVEVVTSLVEVGVLLGVAKVISKAEGEEAAPVDQSKMFPHENSSGEFWKPVLTKLFLWSVLASKN